MLSKHRFLQSHRATLERDLSQAIRPELDREGLAGAYVVFASEMGLRMETITGCTCRMMSGVCRQAIGDRWNGNGPTVLVNDTYFAAHASDAFGALGMLSAVATHETCHALDGPYLVVPGSDSPPVGGLEQLRQSVASFPPMISTHQKYWSQFAPDHGPSFVRLAVHLALRFQFEGWIIDWPSLHNWNTYNNLRYPEVIASLVDEVRDLRDQPLSELARIPAPESFLAMWPAEKEIAA